MKNLLPPYELRKQEPPKARDVSALIDAFQQAREVGGPLEQMEQEARKSLPVDQAGLIHVIELDLSSAEYGEKALSGYELIYLAEGSTAGGRLDIELGGNFEMYRPGDRFSARFSRFRVSRSASSVTSGTARLLILKQPDTRFNQLPDSSKLGALRTATTTQTTNSTANGPSGASAGMSLEGLRAIRLMLQAGSAETLSGAGTIRLHYYEPGAGAWHHNVTEDIDLSAFSALASQENVLILEREVGVPYGRIYAEARSVTASGANVYTVLQGWG